MQKAIRFIGLLAIFAFVIGCCAKKVPKLEIKRDIPDDDNTDDTGSKDSTNALVPVAPVLPVIPVFPVPPLF